MKATAIILAGGLGTRMEKVCQVIPKTLLEFNGTPFLVYLVDWLRTCCNEIIIAAGHNPEPIEAIFNQECWKKKDVRVVGEKIPLGTGGAIRLAASYSTNNTIFVCNGDTVVSDINLIKIVKKHLESNSQITTVLTKNENMVQNRGAITICGNLVIGFEEGKGDKKITSDNASSTGCYVMNRDFILNRFPAQEGDGFRKISLEKELLPLFVSLNLMNAFILERNSHFIDFGNPRSYEMLKNNERIIHQIYKKGSWDEKQDANKINFGRLERKNSRLFHI